MTTQKKQWIAYGYTMSFEWNASEAERAVCSIVMPGWKEIEDRRPDTVFKILKSGDHFDIIHDDNQILAGQSAENLIQSLKRFCHIDLATYAPDLVFVHAGVVLTKFGLVVTPGRSYAGKSTLTKSLVEAGAKYYTDEYAIIDKAGLVHSFPRALSQRLPGGKVNHIPAVDLGWSEDLGPVPIRAVLSCSFSKDGLWSPEEGSRGKAILALLENTVSARTEPERALRYLSKAMEAAVFIESNRGESDETARLILEWMATL